MSAPTGPGQCRCPADEHGDVEPAPTASESRKPLTFDRVKLAAEEFGQLSGMLGNDDVAELCSLLAQLLDETEPSDVDRLFGGWKRLAIVDSEERP